MRPDQLEHFRKLQAELFLLHNGGADDIMQRQYAIERYIVQITNEAVAAAITYVSHHLQQSLLNYSMAPWQTVKLREMQRTAFLIMGECDSEKFIQQQLEIEKQVDIWIDETVLDAAARMTKAVEGGHGKNFSKN